MRKLLLLFGFWVLAGCAGARAQEAPLSADDLNYLGVTAQQVAQLQVVNDKVTKNAGAAPGLTMERVLFTNAGGNRFLWRVDFAGAYPVDNSNIIFYINTDNDEKTGRQNYQGIDLMIWVENGATRAAVYTPDGTVTTAPADVPATFALVQGRQLFLSVDLDLHQQDGQTVVPMRVIAQTNKPLASQSGTPMFVLRGAPVSPESKPQRVAREYRNENVVFTWGLRDLRRIHDDKANVVLPITEAQLSGWYVDNNVEYRENSARLAPGSGRGTIAATVPQSGRFHPAFIFYDEVGKQAISIRVNGEERGIAVAADDDNDQKLFALARPLDLKKGDRIELHNLNNDGNYRTEDLLLLKELFPQKANQYTFRYISATRPWQREGAMRVTFTSSWPVQAKVQYGPTPRLGSEVAETTIPLNNHRVFLTGLKEGQKYYYRLAGPDRSGRMVYSPVGEFVFQAPQYPAAVAKTQNVALKLSETPGGVAWPVRSGVPLPRGEVFEIKNVRLLNASGRPLSVQKRVLARWHDGSIRWVLLSFLAAPSDGSYQLQYGAAIQDQPAGALASQKGGDILVDTGALQWNAKRAANGAYQLALLQGRRELLGDAQLVITAAGGKSYSSAIAPDEVSLVENGAQHAVVLLRGKLGNPAQKDTYFRYALRWYFTRNSPLARVQVTLINDQTGSVFSDVKSAVLQFQLPAANGEVTLPAVGTVQAPVEVLQTYDNQFTAQTPQGEKSGERFPGWLQWQSGAQKFSLAVRNFWQLYPKALSVRGDTLEIGLAPPVDAATYARFKDTVEEYRSVYYLMDGNYKLRAGVSFTTEIALDAAAISNGAQLADYVNRQPLLVASPEYYRDSKAFGDIGLGDEFPLVQSYNEKTASAFANYLADRDRLHEYGLMNYGDWWGERGINWGNVEYDTQHAFILQFARSGDIRFLRAAEDAAIHNRDIDTVHVDVAPPERHFSIGGGHYPASAASTGRVWAHSIGHVGGYFTQRPVEGQGSPVSSFTASHTWTEGHYEYYFLTGDTRSLETANSIADVYDTYGVTDYDFTNCRVPGWTLIFTMGAYNATNDPFYLNAAHIIVDRVLERQTPDGGWDRQLVPGHCTHLPRHHGNAGFMVGVLMSGLKYYAEATGDPRAKESIVKAAHFMINDMWIPEAKAFRYTSCPTSSIAPGLNLLIGEGIAYAWRQTREPELRHVALDAMETIVARMDGMGKNISMELRSTARQLYDINEMLKIQDPISVTAQAKVPAAGAGGAVQFSAEAKTLKGEIKEYSWEFGDGATGEGAQVTHEYPNGGSYKVRVTVRNGAGEEASHALGIVVPPPFLQKMNTETDVLMQAEEFKAQGGGEVSIVSGRAGALGKAITKWEANPGHWVEWSFNVPVNGEYQITLKYASGSPQTERTVQIDGQYPDPALQKVLLPGTGGYSTGADNWKFWKLLDGAQKPLQIPLQKGAHTLRITNAGGGLALDFILIHKVQ